MDIWHLQIKSTKQNSVSTLKELFPASVNDAGIFYPV